MGSSTWGGHGTSVALCCLLYSYPIPPYPGHVPATSLPHNTHHQGHSRNGSSGNIQGTSDMHVSFSANNGRDAPLLAGEDLKLMESLDDEYVGMCDVLASSYTPRIHPLYTFIAVHTPVYTQYTCIYTIYTPNTPLNTPYTPYTPYIPPNIRPKYTTVGTTLLRGAGGRSQSARLASAACAGKARRTPARSVSWPS